MFIFVGLAIIAFGIYVTAKTEWLLRTFGRVAWFERHLGFEGGSRLGYKLLGMAIIFIGILVLTDMWGGFMRTITYPLTKFNR